MLLAIQDEQQLGCHAQAVFIDADKIGLRDARRECSAGNELGVAPMCMFGDQHHVGLREPGNSVRALDKLLDVARVACRVEHIGRRERNRRIVARHGARTDELKCRFVCRIKSFHATRISQVK